MAVHFAIDEGLIDPADVHSDYDESEVEYERELERLEEAYPGLNPAVVYQYLKESRERREIEEMKYDLEHDFPDFQDDTCKAILQHVCEHDSEGSLTKRRRIMEDAKPLSEAWKSAYRLKNAFRRTELPEHFNQVCLFLGLDLTELG